VAKFMEAVALSKRNPLFKKETRMTVSCQRGVSLVLSATAKNFESDKWKSYSVLLSEKLTRADGIQI